MGSGVDFKKSFLRHYLLGSRPPFAFAIFFCIFPFPFFHFPPLNVQRNGEIRFERYRCWPMRNMPKYHVIFSVVVIDHLWLWQSNTGTLEDNEGLSMTWINHYIHTT